MQLCNKWFYNTVLTEEVLYTQIICITIRSFPSYGISFFPTTYDWVEDKLWKINKNDTRIFHRRETNESSLSLLTRRVLSIANSDGVNGMQVILPTQKNYCYITTYILSVGYQEHLSVERLLSSDNNFRYSSCSIPLSLFIYTTNIIHHRYTTV